MSTHVLLVGLLGSGGYLTEDKTGQLNGKGKTLKDLSRFTVTLSEGRICTIKTLKGKFIKSSHKDNEVLVTDGSDSAKECKWELQFRDSGLVAFYSQADKTYLTTGSGVGSIVSKVVKGDHPAEATWQLVLTLHPQVLLRQGKTPLWVSKGEVSLGRPSGFGKEHSFTLERLEARRGSYAIKCCNNMYLQGQGAKVAPTGNNVEAEGCLWSLEPSNDGTWSFKNLSAGTYLNVGGRTASLGAAKPFTLEASNPQVTIRACINDKLISIQQQNIMCTKTTVNFDDSDLEVYAVQQASSDGVTLETPDMSFFSCTSNGTLAVEKKPKTDPSLVWTLHYNADGSCLISHGGRYWSQKALGGPTLVQQASVPATPGKELCFRMALENRDALVLQTDDCYFVGADKSGKLIGVSQPQAFTPVYDAGAYTIKDANGKAWVTEGTGIVLGGSGSKYFFEIYAGKLAIKDVASGSYVRWTKQNFVADAAQHNNDTDFVF